MSTDVEKQKMETTPPPKHPVRETRAAAKRREARAAKERVLAQQNTDVPAQPSSPSAK